jgi:hypothetical protein
MKAVTMMIALAVVPATAFAEGYPVAEVKAMCESQFPGDFFMQKGCIDLQRSSFDTRTQGVEGMPEDVATGIVTKCTADFPQDFFMQKGCIDLQSGSWRDMNN